MFSDFLEGFTASKGLWKSPQRDCGGAEVGEATLPQGLDRQRAQGADRAVYDF